MNPTCGSPLAGDVLSGTGFQPVALRLEAEATLSRPQAGSYK